MSFVENNLTDNAFRLGTLAYNVHAAQYAHTRHVRTVYTQVCCTRLRMQRNTKKKKNVKYGGKKNSEPVTIGFCGVIRNYDHRPPVYFR